MNNRGQIWTEYVGGIAVLILVGLFLVNIGQIWTYDQRPLAVENDIPAERVALFDNVLEYWAPLLCFVAVVVAVIARGRESEARYGS